MDIDAEFAKLQEEARHELARRRQLEGEEELPRQLMGLEEVEDEEGDPDGIGLATRLALAILALLALGFAWQTLVVPLAQALLTLVTLTVGGCLIFALVRAWRRRKRGS